MRAGLLPVYFALGFLFAIAVAADDAPAASGNSSQPDWLQLDSSLVTGNQELPKVMYVVPWQDAGMGDLSGRPVNSLLDEVLAPVDREEFQRQVRYFGQLDAPVVVTE